MMICNDLFDYIGLDAVLILSPANTFYVSGFQSSNCQIILTKHKYYFITDMRYFNQAKIVLGDKFELIAMVGQEYETVKHILHDLKITKFGWDGDISYFEYVKLNKAFGDLNNLYEISDKISQCRDLKQDYELNKIIKAQQITDNAFEYILTQIKADVTEVEIAAGLEYFILKNNCALAFDSIVAFGKNASSPHAHRGLDKLKSGDFVLMDFGAKFEGYCSDMTRTVGFGEISTKNQIIYNTVLTANELAINYVGKGKKACDCDAVARNYITEQGFGQYFTHSLGHGVGIDIHEGTALSKNNNQILQKNMVVTIEPGIYIPNECGVRIEDMVVVKDDGIQNLTKSNKKLIIL